MSTFNIEYQSIGDGNLFSREESAAHITREGTLAVTALQYAQTHGDGNPTLVAHYMQWLSDPASWDSYGVASDNE